MYLLCLDDLFWPLLVPEHGCACAHGHKHGYTQFICIYALFSLAVNLRPHRGEAQRGSSPKKQALPFLLFLRKQINSC